MVIHSVFNVIVMHLIVFRVRLVIHFFHCIDFDNGSQRVAIIVYGL